MICGWASPPMAPTRCDSAPSPRGDEHGGEGVRRSPARRHLGRVARDEREADAAVVQEDARGGLDEMRAEVQRVGLRQRDAEAVGVQRAQVRGVAVARSGPRRGRSVPRPGRHVGRRHRAARRPGPPAAARRSGSRSASPSAPSKSTPGGRGRRRARSRRGGGPTGDRPGRSRARPPRPRRRRPASGSPATGAARSTGRGPRRRRAAACTTTPRWWRGRPGAKWPPPSSSRPRPNSPPVEAVPAVARRWRAACGRCPGSRTVCPMSSGPSGHSSPAPGRAWTRWLASASMMEAAKPSDGQLDRRRQHLVERQPPVALVQGEPAVDRAGHLHAADVAPHRHGRHPLGAHAAPRRSPAPARPMESSASGGEPRRRDHGQHVAPEPAQVRAHDGHRRPGGHGGVGRRAAPGQHGEARRRGQLVGGGHHAAQAGPRSEGGEGERHGPRIVRRPARRRSGRAPGSPAPAPGMACCEPVTGVPRPSERSCPWPRPSRRKRPAAISRRPRRSKAQKAQKVKKAQKAQKAQPKGAKKVRALARSEHGREEQARRQAVCVPQGAQGAVGRRQARPERRGALRSGRGGDRQGARPGLATHQGRRPRSSGWRSRRRAGASCSPGARRRRSAERGRRRATTARRRSAAPRRAACGRRPPRPGRCRSSR